METAAVNHQQRQITPAMKEKKQSAIAKGPSNESHTAETVKTLRRKQQKETSLVKEERICTDVVRHL